jgi:hypothetical protein
LSNSIDVVTAARKVDFKLGDLQLILLPRLERADLEWMNSLRGRKQPFTPTEAEEITNKAAELLVKCARDHAPDLTTEQVLDEMPAGAADRYNCMASIAIAMLQVMGVIPTDQV